MDVTMLRTLFLVMLASTLLASAPARADQPPFATPPRPDDVARVQTCLNASELFAAERACIGLVYTLCLREQPEEAAATNEAQRLCFERESAAWRGLADESGDQIERLGSQNVRRLVHRLRTEHRQWMYTRCAYEASIYEGGSFARVVLAHCYRNAHAELAISLYWRANSGGQFAWPLDPGELP